ncbi:MAG: galactokinase [Actinobacteria bacterium]|nr:galactokinase [Actinomycetota bacterium]
MKAREFAERRREFAARFGSGDEPRLYFAPGRVNLIGEHTDYNGGLVLPLAIERGTYVLMRRREAPPTRLYSAVTSLEAEFDPREPGAARRGDWADYAIGVFSILARERGAPPPCEALYFGDLPLEAGLSSSASLEVATAVAASSLGIALSPEEAARVAWRAENEFVGMECGIMDQYAVALGREGHLLLLDCGTLAYRHVPFDLPGASLVVSHTGLRRSLLASEYNLRRRECEQALSLIAGVVGERENLGAVSPEEFEAAKDVLPEVPRMRAEHVVYENARVREACAALAAGDPEELGLLLNRSHASLRDLFQVSCPELDALQEISLRQPGVWGCRMTGAGFGGCVIVLLEEEALAAYLDTVPELYRRATGREPSFLAVSPSAGARPL